MRRNCKQLRARTRRPTFSAVLSRHNLEYPALLSDQVELASGVLPKAGDLPSGIKLGPILRLGDSTALDPKAPHPSLAVIGIEVGALQRRNCRTPIDIPAGD